MRVCGLLRNFEYWKGKQRTTCRKTAPGRELLGTLRLLNRRRPLALYLYTVGVSLCVCVCVGVWVWGGGGGLQFIKELRVQEERQWW